MLGMLCWTQGRVRLTQTRILGLPVLQAQMQAGGYWEEWRLDRAARLLARRGVRRMLPPRDFDGWHILAHRGLFPVDPLPLYRAMAAELTLATLKNRGVKPDCAAVALVAEHVDGDLVRAARALCPLVRNLVLEVGYGGERLARELYWEFGAAVSVDRRADLRVRFSGPAQAGELTLCGRVELLGLELEMPGLELPEELDPIPVLAAAWQVGRIDVKDLCLRDKWGF